MYLKQDFPETVSLLHEDVKWIQLIDYEHAPFRCRKCHNLGHLFRDCPLNKKTPNNISSDNQEPAGFTKVVNRRRGNEKTTTNVKTDQVNKAKSSKINSFEVLANMDTQDPAQEMQKVKDLIQELPEGPSQQPRDTQTNKLITNYQSDSQACVSQEMEMDNPESSSTMLKETKDALPETQIMKEDFETIDIGELDILGLEQACKTGNFDKIPDRQVDKLVEVLNRAHTKHSLGVQIGSQWDGKFITKDNKKRGRKEL